MTAWQIRVPHRDRDEPLSVTAGHCRRLPTEDRDTARAIVLDAATSGLQTAGQLIDRLQGMDAQERRALLDQARAEAGLEPTADVDARDHFAALQRTRVTPGGGVPFCAAEGCNSIPTRFGVPYEPDVRRWHCPTHELDADEGDMQPRGSGLRLSPAGVPVPDDPADDERERDRREVDATRRAAQDEQRVVEAAEFRHSREARDEAHRQELPEHLRPRPAA